MFLLLDQNSHSQPHKSEGVGQQVEEHNLFPLLKNASTTLDKYKKFFLTKGKQGKHSPTIFDVFTMFEIMRLHVAIDKSLFRYHNRKHKNQKAADTYVCNSKKVAQTSLKFKYGQGT